MPPSSEALAAEYIRELESEVVSTRQCLENVPLDEFDWKPHEKSMQIGYLSQLVADIPRWVQYAVEQGAVDFETYPQFKGTTNAELIEHFDKGVAAAKNALSSAAVETFDKTFHLKHGDKILMSSPIGEMVSQTINHLVHHRGQLTVYLRLKGASVPSIYGPSADSGGF